MYICRYPQLIQNCLLKSVAGISFDFMIYNWLGFFCYSVFNLGLYLHPHIRQEYRYRPKLLHFSWLAVSSCKCINRAAHLHSFSSPFFALFGGS